MRSRITVAHWLLLPPTALLATALAQSFGGWVVLAADRAEPVRFTSRELAVNVREACGRALLWVLRPLGWGDAAVDVLPAPGVAADERRPPVVLVPGREVNRAALGFLRTFLRHRGWRCVHPVNLADGDPTLAEHAASLAKQVELVRDLTGAKKVDVVAHGLGGLAAAWWIRHQGGDRVVRRLVTLGTPWRGTRTAVFGRGRICLEMQHGAPVLDGLAPPLVPTVAIWSPDDPIVVPSSSALPEGVESVRIDGAGHVDLLLSARVYRAVQAALELPSPEPPPDAP